MRGRKEVSKSDWGTRGERKGLSSPNVCDGSIRTRLEWYMLESEYMERKF